MDLHTAHGELTHDTITWDDIVTFEQAMDGALSMETAGTDVLLLIIMLQEPALHA